MYKIIYLLCIQFILCVENKSFKADPTQCALVKQEDRLDCYPQNNANQQECESRGCCWSPPANLQGLPGVPYCFYQPKSPSYTFKNVKIFKNGIEANLENSHESPYPRDVQKLKFIASYLSDSILRIKILDADNERYESPFPVEEELDENVEDPKYGFEFAVAGDNEGFRIFRKSDNVSIFDVTDMSNFIYSDQFLQITTKLASENLYGLGEQRKRMKLSTHWSQITMFNHDTSPRDNINIYGTHPFYVLIENSTNAHGVFLKNSNGMDIVLQPTPALTYRTIGGIFDFYFFLGPTPAEVLQQYQEIVGKPKMPPYWSLGFHLCRYGIKSLENTKNTLKRNLDVGIPIETQWNDLDYMEKNNDFTYDKSSFSGLPDFVQELHDQGRRYVVLIDPGVSGTEDSGTYLPYDRGVELDVFMKNSTGGIFEGKVWNYVSTVFPDFTHPNAYVYWKEMLKLFHDAVPFDGAWIDMNEPSNNENLHGCPDNELENPPYFPNIDGQSLKDKTVCMSAEQYGGVHYNLHNLYGISEANITSSALSEILGQRSLVISRSTFAGHGRYGGHWSGDIYSSWSDLSYSIPHMLDFSLFGVPLMGSDICGFTDDTTEELCNRWMQLGAFYPFSRNHNTIGARDQDPAALGQQVVKSSKKALEIRYRLLPYLYTLFWQANQNGTTVARPLFIEFPQDPNTYSIDTTFMWGSALLIAPVLEDNPSSISVYLPSGFWYDFYSHDPLKSNGESFEISTDKDTIPLFIRGGQVLFMQSARETTEGVRNSDLRILAALDESGVAEGVLYWDDGISIDVGEDYWVLNCRVFGAQMSVVPVHVGKTAIPQLFSVEIIGLNPMEISDFEVNQRNHTLFKQNNKGLLIENLNITNYPITLTWYS